MIAAGGGLDQVAATERELSNQERSDERIAGHRQVAVICPSDKAAFARGVEPPGDCAISDDRLWWPAVVMIGPWATASASPSVVWESSVTRALVRLTTTATTTLIHRRR